MPNLSVGQPNPRSAHKIVVPNELVKMGCPQFPRLALYEKKRGERAFGRLTTHQKIPPSPQARRTGWFYLHIGKGISEGKQLCNDLLPHLFFGPPHHPFLANRAKHQRFCSTCRHSRTSLRELGKQVHTVHLDVDRSP